MGTAAVAAFRNDTLSLIERLMGMAAPSPEDGAKDEQFWRQVREAFSLDPNIANFNNGGCSPSPHIVADSLRRQQEYANQAPSYYMWRHQEPEIEPVRARLAKMFGCDPEELAITRNASESLQTCLFGFDLKPGDEILTTTQDYPRMITTLKQRERRDGVKMVQVNVPAAPKSLDEIVRAFEGGLTDRTKMILVSHVVFMTGQINPVRLIVDLGSKRGIPVIVDGAHAFAQFPFQQSDLQCEFYGCSLHKWLLAPVGTGFLYVKKKRIPELWSLMASNAEQSDNIRKYEEIGTHSAAVHNAIGEALTFYEMLGGDRKAARLRYLRSRWTEKLNGEKNVVFHTNLAPEHSCALTNVEIVGIDPNDLTTWLLDKKGIFVTPVAGIDFHGIRVSPNVYTTVEEIDRFGEAMLTAARKGIH